MLLPVCSLITCNGLKPALIICNKSCPMSLPVALIWEKARVRLLNFSLSPMEMSPMAFKCIITSLAGMLNASMVCAPDARSCIIIGVRSSYSFICSKSSPPICSPARVLKEVCRLSISLRMLMTLLSNWVSCWIEKYAPIPAAIFLRLASIFSVSLLVALPRSWILSSAAFVSCCRASVLTPLNAESIFCPACVARLPMLSNCCTTFSASDWSCESSMPIENPSLPLSKSAILILLYEDFLFVFVICEIFGIVCVEFRIPFWWLLIIKLRCRS